MIPSPRILLLSGLGCAVLLAADVRAAEPEGPVDLASSDLLNGSARVPLGYAAYAGTFYDLGATIELSSWPTGGKHEVFLSGFSYEEHKGVLMNLVLAILAMSGGPSGQYVQHNGQIEYNPEAAGQFRKEYVDNVAAGAASLPFSFAMRAYHDAFGSDMNGWALDLGYGNTLGAPSSGAGYWQLSLSMGSLDTNRRGAPPVEPVPGAPPMERVLYSRGWFGGALDVHLGLPAHRFIGVQLKLTAAFSTPAMLLVEAGPELHLGNRVHLRVLATSDLSTFATSEIGTRVEGVVRF
jgi:hypothetical protein